MSAASFPPAVERLLWDVDPVSVDPAQHADYLMERIMTRGTWEAMQWLRSQYTRQELAAFLGRRGQRLSPRDLAYWCVIAGIELPISPGGARPTWAGA